MESNTSESLDRAPQIHPPNQGPRSSSPGPSLSRSTNEPSNHPRSAEDQTLESRPVHPERRVYEPNEQTYRFMSSFCVKNKNYELAAHYARLAEHRAPVGQAGARKRTSKPAQHVGPMPPAAARYTEVGNPPLEFRPIRLVPGSALTAPSKSEFKQTREALKKCHRDIVPINHQPTARTGSVAGVAQDNPNPDPGPNIFDSNFRSAAGGAIFKVEWNCTAFPIADEGRITKILLQGGARTAQTFRLGNDADNYAALLYYVASVKTILKNSDAWIIDNPDDFERQWVMVERLIEDWYHDKHMSRERQSSGALGALQLLEGAYALEAAWQCMPQRSFWFFWVEGMRQVLQYPRLSSEAYLHFKYCGRGEKEGNNMM